MRRITIGLALIIPTILFADPIEWRVQDGGNGHFYEAIYISCNWWTARDLAAEQEWGGVLGHLVTITSFEEESFIWSHFDGQKFWLGAEQPVDQCQNPNNCQDSDPFGYDGGWVWVTEEDWDYTNSIWEPDGVNEDCLQYNNTYPGWNDDECWESNPGFIVEFEEAPVSTECMSFSCVKRLYR